MLLKKCYFAPQLFIFSQFRGLREEVGFSGRWVIPQARRATGPLLPATVTASSKQQAPHQNGFSPLVFQISLP